jgi:hypothetical protein
MTIQEVKLTQEGGSLSGEGDRDGISRSYSLNYVVKTDDATHSPREIEQYFRNGTDNTGARLPYYGRSWRWPYGGSDVESLCVGIDADYRPKSGGYWDVKVEFKPDPEDEQERRQSVDGESTDPEEWLETVETSSTQISVPAEFGIFRGFDPPNIRNDYLVPGRVYPVVNSAMSPLVPQPDRIIEIEVIRLSKYVRRLDVELPFRGALNNDFFQINKQPDYAFIRQFAPYAVWVKRIDGVCERINGLPWVHREIELWVHPESWWEQLLDRGIHRRCAAGDPKQGGGVISNANTSNLADPERPKNEVLTDDNGNIITQPQLLNGNGQPLENLTRPVWMKWQFQKDRPLAGFPW